jgi:HEAT repeat protein
MNLDTRESRVSLREAGMLKEMERLLRSPYERVVIHGIDLLEENFPDELEGHLAALLDHVSPRVRSRALQRVRARSLDRFRGSVARLIHDADGEVQVEALSTHCALEGTDPFDAIHEYLTAEDPRVRAAAILCITELAPRESEARLRGVLERLMRDGTPAERVTAAEALGRRAPGEIHHLLTPLLTDSDLAVRRAALRSAGRAQLRAHVPVMIEALGQRPTEEAARSALATLGDRVVGTLGDYLCDASVPIEIRYAIPRALGEIHTQGSADALFRLRERGDFKLGYRVLKAANHIRSSAARVEFPRAAVTEDIEADVRGHLFALVHYRSCPVGRGPLSPERLLCVALNERMDQALNRIFRRLALLYPPQNILAAYRGVVSLVPRPRGHAIEYLENALSLEHRALVLPLVDDTGDEGKLRLAERRYGMRRGTLDDSLEAFLGSDDDWLRACALYVVGSRKERRLLPLVQSSLENSNPLVRETASWAALAIATV